MNKKYRCNVLSLRVITLTLLKMRNITILTMQIHSVCFLYKADLQRLLHKYISDISFDELIQDIILIIWKYCKSHKSFAKITQWTN